MATYTVFGDYVFTANFNGGGGRTLGIEFEVTQTLWITHYRCLRPVSSTPSVTSAALWEIGSSTPVSGSEISITGTATVGAWTEYPLPSPIQLDTGVSYRVGAFCPGPQLPGLGGYWDTGPGSAGITNGPLTAPSAANAVGTKQGPYQPGSALAYPDSTNSSKANYAVDLVVTDVDPNAAPELEGFGSTTSDSSGTGADSTTRLGSSETLSDGSTVSGGGTTARDFTGASESLSAGFGGGSASHSGSGSGSSTTVTSGDGRIVYLGEVESGSAGSGAGDAAHLSAGSTAAYDSGSSTSSTARSGYGDPALTSTSDGTSASSSDHSGHGQVTSSSRATGSGYAVQIGSAGIARPVIGMSIRLIDASGNAGEFLPDWTTIGFTDKYNANGTVAIEYASEGVNASLLDGTRVEGALFDGTLEIPNTRFLVTQSERDGVKETTEGHTFKLNCPLWVPKRLEEATVYPPNFPDTTVAKTQFNAATPGEIIGTLIQKARGRGAATDIDQFFDAQTTTTGDAWEQVVTIEIDPGGSIFAVLKKLTEMGVCDWTSHKRELVLLNPDSGADRTAQAEPVVLNAGRDLLDAPEKRDTGKVLTAVLVTGKDGLTVERVDQAEETRQGQRIEGYVSVTGVEDTGTLNVIGDKTLQKAQLSTESFTHGLALFSDEGPQPWVDYTVGDYLFRDIGNGAGPKRYRVAQLSATYAKDGTVTGSVTLGTRYDTTAQKLAEQIDALTNGNDAASASPAESPAEDNIAPEVPTGLVVSSNAYTNPNDAGTFAAVQASWNPVQYSADGSVIRDLSGYDVRWRVLDSPYYSIAGSPTSSELSWSPVPSDVGIGVQVRATDRFGNASAWSTEVEHLTAADATPPPVPTAPVVTSYLGQLKITWNGGGV